MKPAVQSCTGAVLAGGAATRYGGLPKGLESLGGTRMIDRLAAEMSQAADDLILIANDPAAAQWLPGVRTEPDLLPGRGALGGIHSALVHAATAVLVVAWDMPFVAAPLLAAIREHAEVTGADVVVPASGSRREMEPLCAYYSPACISPIAARLAAGDRRVVGFYDDVRVERLTSEQIARFGDPAVLFMNVNSPLDMREAARLASIPSSISPAKRG
jgi:molybdopterin-guanine dinucleotide biosynthesis protein A